MSCWIATVLVKIFSGKLVNWRFWRAVEKARTFFFPCSSKAVSELKNCNQNYFDRHEKIDTKKIIRQIYSEPEPWKSIKNILRMLAGRVYHFELHAATQLHLCSRNASTGLFLLAVLVVDTFKLPIRIQSVKLIPTSLKQPGSNLVLFDDSSTNRTFSFRIK